MEKIDPAGDCAVEFNLQLRAISDNLPGGMVYQIDSGFDGTQRRLTYVSRGVEALHEIRLADVTEDPSFVYEAIDPDYRPLVVELEAAALRTMKPFQVDVQVTLPSGRQGWRSFMSAPRRLPDGRLLWDGIEFDITARKQAEDDYRELQQQLLQTQKMESIGQLAGGIAHDFNNMLSVILGHAETALGRLSLEGHGVGSPLYANLKSIRSAAERSADLTRQLLAFARRQAVAPRVLDLNRTISGMLAMLTRLIGENIELSWTPSPGAGHVLMDPSQMDQILVNLCVNSRDAIAGRGRITISSGVAAFDDTDCSHHGGYQPGTYAILTVTDDGCGMDDATISRLFEPFFTTKAVGRGTGLGLATVYGIVRQNDGFIRVNSVPGNGSTFSIYLPQCPAKNVAAAGDDAGPQIKGGCETILLVEDEPLIRELMTAMLEPLGYTVFAAGTPAEAIRIARQHSGRIDLLVTDMILPEMNGRELAELIVSIVPGIRLMFISGYMANLIAPHGVLEPGIHFLPKPFSLEELSAKIRHALEA